MQVTVRSIYTRVDDLRDSIANEDEYIDQVDAREEVMAIYQDVIDAIATGHPEAVELATQAKALAALDLHGLP
ncbi:hypothetical protein RIF23_14720 [Lipingzhangella sp. LS1_29]|uniref:Uncharacterized protein n=1 Tax=Lipingzhangella rawalii TaxID=2055835 RepID=A0ABU2H9N4_9ACTN|nr:hypothetical protein [Lipingzhangella rawalii]MDS1271550.1 hypothetical protein [Lipingzhangella rawalii]